MSDTATLMDLWAVMREYIPAKERKDAADQFIALLNESGLVDVEVELNELFGTCGVLDKAIKDLATELDLCVDTDDYNEDWDE